MPCNIRKSNLSVRYMANITINPDQFAASLESVLEEYRQEAFEGVRKETKLAMKRLVKRTKNDAPKRELPGRAAGTYAKHITSRVLHQSPTGYVEEWYVKAPEYPLTHLLNDGHALHQGGRAQGTRFLTNASADEVKAYELAIRQVIERASR